MAISCPHTEYSREHERVFEFYSVWLYDFIFSVTSLAWKFCINDSAPTWRPFYWHGLIPIPTWISNNMPSKAWDEITYLFPNFKSCTVEVWETIRNFIPYIKMSVITYPCWDKNVNNVNKRGHWRASVKLVKHRQPHKLQTVCAMCGCTVSLNHMVLRLRRCLPELSVRYIKYIKC